MNGGIHTLHTRVVIISFELLGLNFDCFWAVSEVPVLVSQRGAGAVNLLCTKLVSEIFLESDLAGTHNPVDKKCGEIWCQFVNNEFITDYYENRKPQHRVTICLIALE